MAAPSSVGLDNDILDICPSITVGDLDAEPHASAAPIQTPSRLRSRASNSDGLASPRSARIVARALYDPSADATAVLSLLEMYSTSLRQGGASSVLGARGPFSVVHALLQHAGSDEVISATASLLAELIVASN